MLNRLSIQGFRRHAGKCMLMVATLNLLFGMSPAASAAEARKVGWGDLKLTIEFEDPFAALSEEQLLNLGMYARVKILKTKAPEKVSDGMAKEAREAEKQLRDGGIDIEGLLAKREEITKLRRQRASATNPELDGKPIRMPGYALPLEHDGKNVTEFLLVPWVGACIHTPPPPPNQIVYVTLKEGFEVKSRFEPVWVNGEMSIGGMSKELFLIDGSSQINVGYSVKGGKAERYEALAAKPVPRRGRAHN